MDLTGLLNRIATEFGPSGIVIVILMVTIYWLVKKREDDRQERLQDLKSNYEVMQTFTTTQKERQATFEQIVTQMINVAHALDLAAQSNAANGNKIQQLVDVANRAMESNNKMREAIIE